MVEDEACASFLMGGTSYGVTWVLALVGRVMLSKSLIKISADEWGCSPLSCLAWGNPVLESIGSMIGLKATSTRTYANGEASRTAATVCLCPWSRPLSTHLHRRPQTFRGRSDPGLFWGHCSFSLVLVVHRILLCPSGVCFFQSCESFVTAILRIFVSVKVEMW